MSRSDASRPQMRVLCVFGRYQYGVPERGDSTEIQAFLPAFEVLGCEVRLFDSWTRQGRRDYRELNEALVAEVTSWQPDMIFHVPLDAEIWTETWALLKATSGAALVLWTTDDTWKFATSSRYIARYFHLVATTYPEFETAYHAAGQPQVAVSQWAAPDPVLHAPLPASECQYDVTFVGAAHGERPAFIERLRELGLTVQCFGHGWPEGSVSADDYFRILRESRVSLNMGNSAGRDQLKARTFEIPGAGGLLATQGVPGLDAYYEADREIVVWRDAADCAAQVQALLADPTRRDEMARAGHERTRREHTYSQRLAPVIEQATAARDAAPTADATAARATYDATCRTHREGGGLRLLRRAMTAVAQLPMGRERGARAARRATFELSRRLRGGSTYSGRGWYGRMYPWPNDRRDLDGLS